MDTQTYTIAEQETKNGLAVLAWKESIGLHIRLDGRLVGWNYSSSEIAEYQYSKLVEDKPQEAGKEVK